MSTKWTIELLYKELQVKDWKKVEECGLEYLQEVECWKSVKGKTRWGRKKCRDYNSIKWPEGDECIGITSRRIKEKELLRVANLLELQGRKAKQGWRAEVWSEMFKVEL